MLGSLFKDALSSLTPTSPRLIRSNASIESVQEDIHTRSLLYPDAEALNQHQHDQVFPLASPNVPSLTSSSNPFDINPDIELEVKDVRFVVMQEATAFNSAALLFDSHKLQDLDQNDGLLKAGVTGPTIPARRTSLGSATSTIQEATRGSAFGGRRPSHMRATSFAETESQKSAREYREELSTFAQCIFGSSDIMSYKGTGTKVHIIPTESKASPFGDGHGSLGRSSVRGSRLAQSYTSESIMSAPASAGLPRLEKKKVLITRIFPVPLQGPDIDDSKDEYPFPSVEPKDPEVRDKKEQPKQRRTPMYAIGLIVTLPAGLATSMSRSTFRPGSYNDQESLPSSYSSLKPTGWTVLGEGFGVESLDSSLISDADDRIDIITQHWDIIVRTLSQLQSIVSTQVHSMLKQVDVASPTPKPKVRTGSVSVNGRRVDDPQKPKKSTSNAKLVQLPTNALIRDEKLKEETDIARIRIVNGIKIQQVVTRQGRWGIWRDEARLAAKWAGSRESGFFFYNLLSAFLGTHTDWLQALGPQPFRRRYYQLSKSANDEDAPLAARTVIVSHDKMAARKLIFLLSAFLMPNQQQQLPYSRNYRPSTATSFGGYSQSPPSYMPSREESLRRKVNRRKHPHNRTMSFPSQPVEERERRNSDFKTANLPIPGSVAGTRKSSAATSTTITPVTTIPHFSTRQRSVRGTGPVPRPGSSGSLATDDLMRSLKRGDSSGQYSNASSDSQPASRWGSVTSWGGKIGFWPQRRDSTGTTEVTAEEEAPKSKLTQMVEEARGSSDPTKLAITYQIPELPAKQSSTPSLPYVSPIKSSINKDGVIDIDVPLPDFLSNFGSVISSPSSSGYLFGMAPGMDGFEHYNRAGDTDTPVNVGGWLPKYHPDFALQAVPVQDNLEAEVKASMRAEPTPVLARGEESRWVDISTVLIADTTAFTIKRIKYRRFVKAIMANESQDRVKEVQGKLQAISMYGNPYSGVSGRLTPALDTKVEDQFVEDMVMSLDEILTDAVERVIAQPTPNNASGAASHSSQQKNEGSSRDSSRSGRDASDKGRARSNSNETEIYQQEQMNVPRVECKKCILSALEDVAKNVAEERQDETRREGAAGSRNGSILREGVTTWLSALED